MRNRDPVRIVGGLDEFRRHRVARRPQFHRPVVDGICTAENGGAEIGCITLMADWLEQNRAARFIVAMQNMLLTALSERYRVGTCALKHRAAPLRSAQVNFERTIVALRAGHPDGATVAIEIGGAKCAAALRTCEIVDAGDDCGKGRLQRGSRNGTEGHLEVSLCLLVAVPQDGQFSGEWR